MGKHWKYKESFTCLKKIAYVYQNPNFKATFLWSFKKIYSIQFEFHRDGPNWTGNAISQNSTVLHNRHIWLLAMMLSGFPKTGKFPQVERKSSCTDQKNPREMDDYINIPLWDKDIKSV